MEPLLELPFVVGIMADLSGMSKEEKKPLKQRKFVPIDRDTFTDVMQRAAPRVAFRVPNKLTDKSDEMLNVELQFKTMEDFEPGRIAEQVPVLAELLQWRERLTNSRGEACGNAAPESIGADIGAIDRKLTAQMNEILHHPTFQKLEGTWRGLQYLVRQTNTGEHLRLWVLNVTKDELVEDFKKAIEFDLSQTFKKVYEEE